MLKSTTKSSESSSKRRGGKSLATKNLHDLQSSLLEKAHQTHIQLSMPENKQDEGRRNNNKEEIQLPCAKQYLDSYNQTNFSRFGILSLDLSSIFGVNRISIFSTAGLSFFTLIMQLTCRGMKTYTA